MSDKPLLGRPCVVTGAARGLGQAIAEALAAAGGEIVLTYQSQSEKADAVAESIRASGGHARTFQLEVTSQQSIKALASHLSTEFGNLAVLVNNAGINKPTDFDQISEEDWDEVLAVNLKGPFLVTQALLPLLRDGANEFGDASIVNIGSVSGQYGGPRTAHYAASKAGLISLSQVMARFGAEDGIRSNTLAAGIIASDMGEAGLASPAVKKAAETILMKRLGTPNEVGEAAAFLASPHSSYITGQVININGGLYF